MNLMNNMERETQKISALFILEIMGKPPEHLTQSLESLIEKMGQEKGVSINKKTIKNPEKMEKKVNITDSSKKDNGPEKHEDFYSTFAEVEIEVKDLFTLVILLFKYMPAHIEIFSPEVIALTSGGWNDILNELARTIHGYDEVARVMQVERSILQNKLRSFMDKQNKKE